MALRQPRLRGVLALNALVPPLLVGAAYLLSRNNLILWPRYGLFFTFAALIPIAGLWAAPPWDLRRWMAAAFVGGLLASGLAFLFLGQEHPDWRQVTQTIVRHGERQEGVIVHKQNLVFELGRYLPAGWRMFGIGPETTLPLRVAAAADGRTGMWAAFAWDQDSDTQARIRRMLECRFGFRDDYPLHLIALSRYHDGPASAETRPTVCGPPNGFVLDGGECVIDPAAQTLSVQGWVDIADSRSALRVTLDGEDGGDAVRGTAAPDVRTPPTAPGATRVWFTRSIDTTQLPDGSLLPLTLVVAPPDGPPETAKETLLCVKRSGTAIAGTPGTRVVAGWLGTPTRGKRFRSGTPMWVSGWAFATTGITHIVLQIDGREVLRSRQHGFARPEVGTLYPTLDPDLTNSSGFAVRLDTSGIAPGRHELRAACVLPDGSSVPLPPVRRFDVIAAPSS